MLALTFAALTALPGRAAAEDVYFTTPALLTEFFKTSERVSYVKVEGDAGRDALTKLLGYAPAKRSYVVFVARTGAKVDGYAVIDDELGQHQPITFGVKLSPDGAVERAEIMVYREGYGAEVREARFRRQFTGKTAADRLRLGDDVVAISGATLSSKAMATGIRRAAALVSVVKAQALDAERGSLARAQAP
ncbi:FMN-binding protein [Myxococcota bacterium]|nr:FMN-binding protein [Myxococcota bacterium]